MAKKLSILKLFESLGFVWGSYVEDSDRFRHSFKAFVSSYTTLFISVFSAFNLVYCWKRFPSVPTDDDRQLMLIHGDLFYYFAPDTKAFVAFAGWSIQVQKLKFLN